MRTLAILLNSRDERAMRECGSARGADVLALDYELHVRLAVAEREHLTPGDVLGGDWVAVCELLRARAWAFWREHAVAAFGGHQLLAFCPYRHFETLTRMVYAAEVVRGALARVRPERVVVCCEAEGHGLWQLETKWAPFGWIARYLAEEAGCEVELVWHAREGQKRGRGDRGAAERVDLARACGGRPYVLLQASHADLLRQRPLVEALLERNDCAVVQVYGEADAETLARARCGQVLVQQSQVARVADGGGVEAAARRAFNGACRQVEASLRPLFANPHLQPHWDFVFGAYVERMQWQVRMWSELFGWRVPSAVVVNECTPLAELATARGVPVLTLWHGANTDHRVWTEMLTGRICALSARHAARIARLHPARVPFVGGSPEVDAWRANTPRDASADARARCAARRELGLPTDGRVLVVCTANPGTLAHLAAWPQLRYRSYTALLKRLADWVSASGGWRLMIKAHPRHDAVEAYGRLLGGGGARVRVVCEPPLIQCVRAADAVVFPGGISSALFEASLARRPVYLVQAALEWFDAEAGDVAAWPRLASFEALLDELARLSADPDYADGVAAACRRAAEEYFAPAGRSAERCAAWMAAHVDAARVLV